MKKLLLVSLSLIYPRTLSAAKALASRMVGRQVEMERMWKQWQNLSYCPAICLETLRRTMSNLTQDGQSVGRGVNLGPPEWTAESGTHPLTKFALIFYPLCLFTI